jgi:hypothetical protein
MTWWGLCCTSPREKHLATFTFKNGTRVKALNPAHAIKILKSISLRDVATVFHVDSNMWVVDFGKGASIEVQGTVQAQVKKVGEWRMYLDRRDLELEQVK